MADHDHDHDHKDKPLYSRRHAAVHAFRTILGIGVGAIGMVVLPSAPAKAGYGACSVSGCPCQAYTGGGNNCQNCGHRYEDHW